MAKKAIVLLAEGFEEIEAVTCIDVLRRAGIEVTSAGIGGKTVKGSRRVQIKADSEIDNLQPYFDACVLPGGMPGAENLAKSNQVKTLLKKAENQGKIIAAICAAPAIALSPLGILDNKIATCYPGMEKNFSQTTTYKTKEVVTDGKIITSQGPATALEFALKIVEQLIGKELANKVSRATLLN